MKHPIATITMEDGRVMKLELRPDIAPVTVEHFTSLSNSGRYDGLTFHRIIKGFMIQGGSPTGDCSSAVGEKTIKGEFAQNGVNNPLKHVTGVISMARSSHPDGASMQFFIMHADAPFLDGQYAAFGSMIEGFDLLEELGNVPTDETPGRNNPPLTPVVMKTVRVEAAQ